MTYPLRARVCGALRGKLIHVFSNFWKNHKPQKTKTVFLEVIAIVEDSDDEESSFVDVEQDQNHIPKGPQVRAM